MRKAYLCPHSRLVNTCEVLVVVSTEGGSVLPILSVCKVYVVLGSRLLSHVRVSVLFSQLTWLVKLVAGRKARTIQNEM